MSIADDIFGTIDKGNEDDLISAIDKFFESKDIDIKTELHAKEIKLLLQIKIYSDYVKEFSKEDAKIIKNMLIQYFRYNLSKTRKSRTEFFSVWGNEVKRKFRERLKWFLSFSEELEKEKHLVLFI